VQSEAYPAEGLQRWVGGSLGQFLMVPVNLTGVEGIEVNFLEP
jgi:hypothetical protein